MKRTYFAIVFLLWSLSLTLPIYSHVESIINKVFEELELYPVADPYQEGYLQVSTIHIFITHNLVTPKVYQY